jgi:hypothetical protein
MIIDDNQILEDDGFETDVDPALEAVLNKDANRLNRGLPQATTDWK